MPLPDFDTLWDYNDPAATELKFLALLPAAEASDAAEHRAYRAELLTQIARTHSLRRSFEIAHTMLDRAAALLGPQDDLAAARPRVRYLLERGRAFNSAGDAARAMPLFVDACELATRAKLDALAVDAAHMIAIAEPAPDGQVKWNRRAIAMAEHSEAPAARRWLASLYNNLGWTLHDQQRHAEALELFEKAVPLREAAGKPRELRIARYAVARALRSLGRVDEALATNRALHAEGQAAGETDPYVCEALGECLLLKGDAAEARPWFRIAIDELSKDEWLRKHEPERLARLEALSRE